MTSGYLVVAIVSSTFGTSNLNQDSHTPYQFLTIPRKKIDCCYDYDGEKQPRPPSRQAKRLLQPSTRSHTTRELRDAKVTLSNGLTKSPIILNATLPIGTIPDHATLDKTVCSEVTLIIHAFYETIEEVGRLYFKGLHLWVPFFCPGRFETNLIQFRSNPSAEFSLLLLCMSLIAYTPPQLNQPPIGKAGIYLQAKTLFTQIQVLRRPSIHLVQAGLFIAVYEYAHRKPDAALATIDICARMGYAVGIHRHPDRPEWTEGWNTWWAIKIFERIFSCETKLPDLPFISSAPDETDLLPHEVSDTACDEAPISSYQVAPVQLTGVGCFGRAAQAAYLLDRVIQTIRVAALPNRVSQLMILDGELQRLFSAVMNRCHGQRGGHCGAVGISIRYTIFKMRPKSTSADHQAPELSFSSITTFSNSTYHMSKSSGRSTLKPHSTA